MQAVLLSFLDTLSIEVQLIQFDPCKCREDFYLLLNLRKVAVLFMPGVLMSSMIIMTLY